MFQSTTQAGLFLKKELEQNLPKVYEKRYPRLWAEEGLYLPSVGDLEEGTKTLIETSITEVGEAVIMSDQADDIPLVDASMDESEFKAFAVVAGYRYSIPELRAAEKAGKSIGMVKMKAVDLAMRQKMHKLAVFGDKKRNAVGLLSSTQVPLDNSSYNAATATAQDHLDFVADSLIKVENDTNLVEGVDTILVPAKLRNIWTRQTLPNTTMSVLSYILETFGRAAGGTLRQIVSINEARNADLVANGVTLSAAGKDRVMFLPVNPDAVERKFYAPQYLEPQLHDITYHVITYAGTSEVIFHYPGSCLYADIVGL